MDATLIRARVLHLLLVAPEEDLDLFFLQVARPKIRPSKAPVAAGA